MRILSHDRALDLLQKAAPDLEGRMIGDGGAFLVWKMDLEVQILIVQEVQVPQSGISMRRGS